MQIYKVGGAVRDPLLGLPVKDTDWVVVGATARQMLDAGYRQVGRDFPVFLHPDTREEYALARTERKSGKGYTGFTVHASPEVTLEEDLRRRDLTINAMAQTEDGRRIDPYGGEKDLSNRILRHVSPAFAEDPLRVLRVARFAARFAPLGFRVAEETRELMQSITDAGELDHLVPERVWQETSRALGENEPGAYIRVLKSCHALAVLLPEIDRLFSITTTGHTSAGEQTLAALRAAAERSPDLPVRFSILVHDIGRKPDPLLPAESGARTQALADLCKRLRVPNDCADLARLVMLYLDDYQHLEAGNAETLMTLFEACDALRKPERFAQFLQACETLCYRTKPAGEAGSTNALADKGLELVRKVDAGALARQGLKGAALGEALRKARVDTLALLFS